jgi:hypothetical protein
MSSHGWRWRRIEGNEPFYDELPRALFSTSKSTIVDSFGKKITRQDNISRRRKFL